MDLWIEGQQMDDDDFGQGDKVLVDIVVVEKCDSQ